jgi:hypothetical protein
VACLYWLIFPCNQSRTIRISEAAKMSSKSSSKVSLEDEILKKVKWRRVGVWFWTSLFVLAMILVVQVPLFLAFFVLLPLVLIRTHIITSSLTSHLGIRYNTKIALFFIDLAAFLIVLISYEWSLPNVSESNYMWYDATKDVNWGRVMAGRVGWAFLASFLFHRHVRGFYDLIMDSVVQRRMFRLRLAILEAMKVSLKLIRSVILYALALWLVLQLFINPISYLMIGSAQSGEGAEEVDSSQIPNSSTSDSRSASSSSSSNPSTSSNLHQSSESLRNRHKRVNANFLIISAIQALLGSSRYILSNMNIMAFVELSKRLFEILCLSFVLEMSWLISSIIFSERFSFWGFEDFSSTLRKSKASRKSKNSGMQHRSLLKSKNSAHPDQLLKNLQDQSSSAAAASSQFDSPSSMLIKCLDSSKPFVSFLALQDLHYISHHTPEMRADLYKCSSSSGEHRSLGSEYGRFSSDAASNWEQLVQFAVNTLNTTSNTIENVMYNASGDIKQEKEKKSEGSKVTSIINKITSNVSSYRKRLDNKIRELFKWARKDRVDVSIESSLASYSASPALVQHQFNMITLLKSVSRLISASTKEDVNGTIASSQQTIPDLLNAMVHLYLVLQDYSAEMGPGKNVRLASGSVKSASLQGHSIAFSFSTSLISTLSEAIYEITTVYYEHLVLYSFSQEHLDVLQRFMDFTA